MVRATLRNPKISKKEYGLIKGALRRVFSRSDLRKQVLEASIIIGYSDNKRKRVKTWCKCNQCQELDAKSNMEVDHIEPVIPLHLSLEELSLEELVNRIWCDISNLQVLCTDCHDDKSRYEMKERRRLKKCRT